MQPVVVGWLLGVGSAVVVWFLLAELTDVTCFIRI
jgi:hypothetical protein